MYEVHEFRSMGCSVVVGGASNSENHAVEQLFADRDRTFSRFRPDSELNRVNGAAGGSVRVSQDFAEMLTLALDAARETDGLVDPTLGAALEAAGYDTDFALVQDDPRPAAPVEPWDPQVCLDERSLVVAPRVKLDLNGVVKGRTVDDALALLDGDGFVSAGGDLAARGDVVVALPRGGAVRLVRGALATSGTDRRAWFRGATRQHHLIDPRTGAPSASPWEQVTVCGLSCVAADVAAKAAFLLGEAGPAWLDVRGLPGRFVTAGCEIRTNHAWSQSLARAVVCT